MDTLRFGENSEDDHNGTSRDTWIVSSSPSSNHGLDATLEADGDQTATMLLRFDVSALTGATVCSANLRITTQANTTSDTLTLHRVLEPWDELAATWTQSTAGLMWSSAGCGPPASCEGENVGFLVGPNTDETSYLVPIDVSLVQGWVTGDAVNEGLAVKATGMNGVVFHAREGVDGKRPSLEITFTPQ